MLGVEALLRWRHPQHGLISPASFIPIAEETGLIVSIGEWVLDEAMPAECGLARWRMQPLVVAVNLSALHHPARFVRYRIGRFGAMPCRRHCWNWKSPRAC
jgi:EAL domain-containing protein (putative c-di-GMP-specific phosphodiesterase class I)